MYLLTTASLMTVLGGRSRTSIYRDIEAGRLPRPLKIGGLNYWRSSDIERLFALNTEAPATPHK